MTVRRKLLFVLIILFTGNMIIIYPAHGGVEILAFPDLGVFIGAGYRSQSTHYVEIEEVDIFEEYFYNGYKVKDTRLDIITIQGGHPFD